MKASSLKNTLVAAFALTATVALSSLSQASEPANVILADGDDFVTATANAPALLTWKEGARYCMNSTANGHDDWRLPTKRELTTMHENYYKDGFNEMVSHTSDAHWYWSASLHGIIPAYAWNYHIMDGHGDWNNTDSIKRSVRCVRTKPSAP